MLEHSVGLWAGEDGVTALQYIFLLRLTPTLTEKLAVNTLVASTTSDVLLSRVPFLPRSTQSRLTEGVADKLHHERGMSTQAARLLYECQACA